jgi:NADP-dependent 3-hydroxy acid dehydrogenase YdfG
MPFTITLYYSKKTIMEKTSKVRFITGASSGFGKAFAEYALSQGYKAVVTARWLDKLGSINDMTPEQVAAIKIGCE